MTQTLTDAIDQLVNEKTFNLDALTAIQELKTKAVAQDRRIQAQDETIAYRDSELARMKGQISTLQREAEKAAGREAELVQREGRVRELELKEAVSTAKGETLEKVFGTIFANVKVRETATRQLPFSSIQPGGYQNTGYMSQPETVERITE